MSLYYYAIDGDDIGKHLEKYALSDNIESLKKLSENVYKYIEEIKKYLEEESATIIFYGGDSILATSTKKIGINIEKLKFDDMSFSAGIGNTCCNATLALKKAKGLGKKRIEVIL